MCITNRPPSLMGLNLQQLSSGATTSSFTGTGTSTQLDTLLRSDMADVATLLDLHRLAQRAGEAQQRTSAERHQLMQRREDATQSAGTVPQKKAMMPRGSNSVFMTHHDYRAPSERYVQSPQEQQQQVPQPQPTLSRLQPEPVPSGPPRYTVREDSAKAPPQQMPQGGKKPEYVNKKLQPGFTAKHHTRHYVQHNYHDHSLDEPGGWEEKEVQLASARQQLTRGQSDEVISASNCAGAEPKGGVPVPFPLRLHEMLDKIEDDGYAGVISWQPHGRAFVVHDVKDFVSTVMPQYFRQTKMTSFQRQLNLYGFSRITRGRDRGGYYHELFLRGRRFLANRMVRTKVKGTRIKAVSSPESEPNFYAMPPIFAAPIGQRMMDAPRDVAPVAPAPRVAQTPAGVPDVVVSSSPPQKPNECQSMSVPLRDESDLLLDFEGMHFHYLDPILKRSIMRDQQERQSNSAPSMPTKAAEPPVPELCAASDAASSARSSFSRPHIKNVEDQGGEFEPEPVEAPSELDDAAMDDFFNGFDVSPLDDEELDHVDNDVDLGFLLEKIVD